MKHAIDTIKTYIEGHWLFVVVTTDSGLTGVGEATYFVNPLAAQVAVLDIAQRLRGADAFRAEFLFQRELKHHCVRDMTQISALSAIDQALWDIKGKALCVPVWELLGGRVRDRVRAILLIEATTVPEMIDKAKAAAAEGFNAIKLKPFVGDWALRSRAAALRDTVDAVAAVRQTVGWDVDIAVEVHRNLMPCDALEFADRLREQSLYFIEDPILPFSVDVNRRVAEDMRVPVAVAERNLTIWEFREYSDSYGVAILRPDIGSAGGFTQMRKIAAIAESRHQRIVPHNFTSPVITAAHIQMAACTSNWDLQGYVREQRSPWSDVVMEINRLDKGYLQIPESPGIGMTLNIEFLESKASYRPFGSAFAHGVPTAADGGLKLQ